MSPEFYPYFKFQANTCINVEMAAFSNYGTIIIINITITIGFRPYGLETLNIAASSNDGFRGNIGFNVIRLT